MSIFPITIKKEDIYYNLVEAEANKGTGPETAGGQEGDIERIPLLGTIFVINGQKYHFPEHDYNKLQIKHLGYIADETTEKGSTRLIDDPNNVFNQESYHKALDSEGGISRYGYTGENKCKRHRLVRLSLPIKRIDEGHQGIYSESDSVPEVAQKFIKRLTKYGYRAYSDQVGIVSDEIDEEKYNNRAEWYIGSNHQGFPKTIFPDLRKITCHELSRSDTPSPPDSKDIESLTSYLTSLDIDKELPVFFDELSNMDSAVISIVRARLVDWVKEQILERDESPESNDDAIKFYTQVLGLSQVAYYKSFIRDQIEINSAKIESGGQLDPKKDIFNLTYLDHHKLFEKLNFKDKDIQLGIQQLLAVYLKSFHLVLTKLESINNPQLSISLEGLKGILFYELSKDDIYQIADIQGEDLTDARIIMAVDKSKNFKPEDFMQTLSRKGGLMKSLFNNFGFESGYNLYDDDIERFIKLINTNQQAFINIYSFFLKHLVNGDLESKLQHSQGNSNAVPRSGVGVTSVSGSQPGNRRVGRDFKKRGRTKRRD